MHQTDQAPESDRTQARDNPHKERQHQMKGRVRPKRPLPSPDVAFHNEGIHVGRQGSIVDHHYTPGTCFFETMLFLLSKQIELIENNIGGPDEDRC